MSMNPLPERGTVPPLRSRTTQDDFNTVMEGWLAWFDTLTAQMNEDAIPGINAVIGDINTNLYPYMDEIHLAGANAEAAAASAAAAAEIVAAAAGSEANASQSEANAAVSESNAAKSAAAASQSEAKAAAAETAAVQSAAAAAASETNAAQSATAAAASAVEAAASEASAADSGTAAAASEASAAASALAAAASETNAAASAEEAEAAMGRCEEIEGFLTEGGTAEATPNSMVKRDALGNAAFNAPVNPLDAANRQWTLEEIGAAKTPPDGTNIVLDGGGYLNLSPAVQDKLDTIGTETFPGCVMMYSGDFSGKNPVVNGVVQNGWWLCDGTNGTPNLVNKFVRGTNAAGVGGSGGADTGSFSVTIGDGGSHSHTAAASAATVSTIAAHTHSVPGGNTTAVTLALSQIPSHTHALPIGVWSILSNGGTQNFTALGSGITSNASGGGGSHQHTFQSGTSGAGGEHKHTLSGNLTTSTQAAHAHSAYGSVATVPAYYSLAYIMKK